ncbi:MAG: DUF3179 domain-containing protein [Ardenticatenia bacterium]|nr:MAG: DUF3179 domain-containing protein [Ardenticatenia bacterium]
MATPSSTPAFDPEDIPPGAAREFSTDFTRHSVPYREILSGGPPKDGIPAIDAPRYVSVEEADEWLRDREPVVLFALNGDARAFPLQILTWHEIVNTEVGGVPVTVTFCPLCNTAIVFDRRYGDLVLDFGTTGRLRYSNLIMYDRQTESWWQQATGEAIVGTLTGAQLTTYPAAIVSWQAFKETYPDGNVLSRETGFNRAYGRNPYVGYDDIESRPFLYDGPTIDGRLPPMARVLTVAGENDAVAFPYDVLAEVHVANETVDGAPIVVFWAEGTASALDGNLIAESRDVGAALAFSRLLDGQVLTFWWDGEAIRDEQTNSRWSPLGQAVEGALAGRQLEPVVSINHFWFSWAAFRPDTRLFLP